MWLVAGLGNPGKQYDGTRHNIGFAVLDRLAEVHGAGSWKEKFDAQIVEAQSPGLEKLLLVKPQSFMNRSGGPIARLAAFFKVEAEKILVVHDEVDLPYSQLRIKSGGGDGGHNGLKSIRSQLGTADFARIRVGVGRPVLDEEGRGPDMAGWVLGRFGGDDLRELPQVIDRSVQAVEAIVRGGVKRAQNAFN
jgi:PTH1 family peptidyl-tRNA hydrolase